MRVYKNYWWNIISTARSLSRGLKITLHHVWNARQSKKPLSIQHADYFNQPDGIATVQYPHESIPVPDTGRYRLHNEIDDCIVCDKCVKICPVDCITIEPIKATEEIGRTSDGSPKRIYAAKFDIDMGKCCFCGLCTTVCPTECLTMTKAYDYSVLDIREHNFSFAEMSPELIDEKKQNLERHLKVKGTTPNLPPTSGEASKRPIFRPKIKPPGA